MNSKYWLLLGAIAACSTKLTACSSSFRSCIDTRTCAAAGRGGGQSDAGDTSSGGDAGDNASGGKSAIPAGSGGQAGDDTPMSTSDAGDGGSAPVVTCDATVDLKSDPKNCGTCGHDCLGGECDLGTCQPLALTPPQTHTFDVATDGVYVYWSGASADEKQYYVARRRVDRSDDVKVIAPMEKRSAGLTIGQGKVYWLGSEHMRVCDAPDCANGPTDFKTTVPDCFQLAFSAYAPKPSLFWACQTVYGQKNGSFWSVPVSGSLPVHIQPTSTNPTGLTSDSDSVYWANSSGFNSQDGLDPDGGVWRYRLSDGATTSLVTGLTAQFGKMAAGGGKLYFDGDGKSILSVPLPNGALKPTKFVDTGSVVGGMVADRDSLYWTDYYQGAVARCPHSGCVQPEVLAPGQTKPSQIAQDSVSIYWVSDYDGGAPVQRIAK